MVDRAQSLNVGHRTMPHRSSTANDTDVGDGSLTVSCLSEIEAGVLELLAAGYSNRCICRTLFLSQPTVDYHLARLRRKLNAGSRVAIVSRAYAFGYLRPEEWPPRVHRLGAILEEPV